MIEEFFGIRRRPTEQIENRIRTLRRAIVLADRDSRLHEETPDGAAVRQTRAELAEFAREMEAMLKRIEGRLGL